MTTVVVDEINERKKRENNIVIFGLQESESDEKKERGEHDLRQIKEIFKDSEVQLEGDAIKKTARDWDVTIVKNRLGHYWQLLNIQIRR